MAICVWSWEIVEKSLCQVPRRSWTTLFHCLTTIKKNTFLSVNVRSTLKYIVKLICASINGNRKKKLLALLWIGVVLSLTDCVSFMIWCCMYNIYLVTKVFFVFTKNKEFQTTSTDYFIVFSQQCMQVKDISDVWWRGRKKKDHPAFFPADVSVRLQSSEACVQRGQWMFGEVCSSWRIGKVSRTKYGHSGCVLFFFLLVHRPDLQVCSDSHLDILVHMLHSSTAQTFYTLILTFKWVCCWWKSHLIVTLFLFPPQVLQNLYLFEADPLGCIKGAECVKDVWRCPAQCTESP